MYVIIWEFEVREGRKAEFERAYGPDGEWALFFRRGEGYLGTELLADPSRPRRYLTIDCWKSHRSYESFRARFDREYAALDKRLEALTANEKPLGSYVTIESYAGHSAPTDASPEA